MAFEVRLEAATSRPTLIPVWRSRELHAPDVPIVANGVVYIYQSGKDSTQTRAAGVGGRGANGAGRGAGGGRGADGGAGAPATTGGRGGRATAPLASPGTNAFLYAFDAETGKELYKSELDSFNHFVNPVVSGGTVYATDWDGKLYAYRLKK